MANTDMIDKWGQPIKQFGEMEEKEQLKPVMPYYTIQRHKEGYIIWAETDGTIYPTIDAAFDWIRKAEGK